MGCGRIADKNGEKEKVIYSNSKAGFTLIEVVVALAILGLVLGGAISTVHQYADQRGYLNSKMISSQVAWNTLMDKYRHAEGWVGQKDKGGLKQKACKAKMVRIGIGFGG